MPVRLNDWSQPRALEINANPNPQPGGKLDAVNSRKAPIDTADEIDCGDDGGDPGDCEVNSLNVKLN